MLRHWTRFVFSTLLVSLGACAAEVSVDAPADTDSEALRALKENELIGSISYGDKKGPYDYTGSPYYEALEFKGAAGEDVTVTVQSGGRVKAWLQDPQNTTLASGVAKDIGQGVELKARLSSAGAHYIVWREVEDEEAKVNVWLQKKVTSPTSKKVSLASLFDGSLTNGDNLQTAEVVKLFAPAETQATLGGFAVRQRYRVCNTVTGCADWQYPSKTSFAYFPYTSSCPSPSVRSFDEVVGTLTMKIPQANYFDLEVQSKAIRGTCRYGGAQCSTFTAIEPNCTNGGSYAGADYGNGVPAPSYVTLQTFFKRSYFFARQTHTTSADGQGTYRQAEYALYGSYTPGEQPEIDD